MQVFWNEDEFSASTYLLLYSGALISYGGLKTMDETKKTFNVPLLIIRRYIR